MEIRIEEQRMRIRKATTEDREAEVKADLPLSDR